MDTLVAASRPQDAVRLAGAFADQAAGTCIPDRLTVAEARVKQAQDDAVAAEVGLAAGKWSLAAERAQASLDVDSENGTARAVKNEAAAHLRVTAKVRQDRWDSLFENTLAPTGALLAAALATFAILLTLARMLIPLATLSGLPLPRTGSGARVALTVLGTVVAVAASALVVLSLPPAKGERVAGTHALWAALLSIAAVGLLSMALASRLRLNVEVHGSDGALDESATGHLIALITRLGASPPQGLEIPRGADVTALSGAGISGGAAGKVLTILTQIWQLLLGTTPWQIRVDVQSADHLSVCITRLGMTAGSAVVDRDGLQLHTKRKGGDDLPDLLVFAAALTLVTLAGRYDGFEALHGVREWRSLGLHDIGTNFYSLPADREAVQAVLREAVHADCRNIPAVVALRNATDREAAENSRETSLRYHEFLESHIATLDRADPRAVLPTDDPDHVPVWRRALLARLMYTDLVVLMNCEEQGGHSGLTADVRADGRADDRSGESAVERQQEISRLIDKLWTRLRSMHGDLQPLAESMLPSVAVMALDHEGFTMAGWKEWVDDPRLHAGLWPYLEVLSEAQHRLDARGHYNFACWLAGDPTHRDFLWHLEVAASDPLLKARARTDPFLSAARNDPAVRRLILDAPRTDLLAIAPFATYAKTLRTLQLTDGHDIRLVPVATLAHALGISAEAASELQQLASLEDSLAGRGCLDALRVEITAWLVEHRLATSERLRHSDHRSTAKRIAADLGRSVAPPTDDKGRDGGCEPATSTHLALPAELLLALELERWLEALPRQRVPALLHRQRGNHTQQAAR